MFAESVGLFDVRDVLAFVQGTIERWCRPTGTRGRIPLSEDERDELACEGVAIMYKLAAEFQPRLDGYDADGRFSGYAAMFLPRKLGDAWHRMHPEHQLRTQPDGKRRWEYGDRAVSLEGLLAEDPDRHALMAAPASSTEIEGWLRRALWEDAERLIAMTVQVARLRAKRWSDQQIADALGLSVAQVRERNAHLEAVRDRRLEGLSTEEALRERASVQIDVAVGVGVLMCEGATVADVAELLQVDSAIVRRCVLMIARVRSSIESFANGREEEAA